MKRTHKDKELDQLQKLKKELEKLKRQNSALRKELAKIDIDRYVNLKELIDKHHHEDQQEVLELELEAVKKQWKCKHCISGYLYVVKYDKINDTFYYRQCNNCSNRTRGKKFTEEVKGLFK